VVVAAVVNQTMNATSAPPHQCAIDFTCEYGLMNDFQVWEVFVYYFVVLFCHS